MLPLAFCYAAAHCASSFSYAGGSVSFAEIVKAAEPVFAAVLATVFYNRKMSRNKWLCLPLISFGVTLAVVKELDFAMIALVSGCLANLFAAVRANENKKFIESNPDLKKRMGCVGNQFALTSILGFLCTIPFLVIKEGSKFGEFITLVKTTPIVKINLIASSLWFYGYNELSTMTLKKTGAVTQSVANTAKRIIVIVGSALVFHESLNPLKALGCAIGIGGVFLYSCIDQLFPPASTSDEAK
jgi:solute carrier family 35, member E1